MCVNIYVYLYSYNSAHHLTSLPTVTLRGLLSFLEGVNVSGSYILSWHLECRHPRHFPPLCKAVTVEIAPGIRGSLRRFHVTLGKLKSLQCFLWPCLATCTKVFSWAGVCPLPGTLPRIQASGPLLPRSCTFSSPSFCLDSIDLVNPR